MVDTPSGGGVGPGSEGASRSAAGGSLQNGTILAGRYRIVQHLGDGAMGSVYLGEHIKIGRKDAIKVLKDSLAADREAMARFVRGARSVSRILHPNVCTIYDFSDTPEGVQFLAMEYIPGETLRDLLTRERTLPLDRVVSITMQAAGALQAAHDAGIVHRDLKPANIMLMSGRDGADIVKVVDFDIAKAEDDGGEAEVTRFGFVVGTPEYMSPEQLTGETLDGRSDVYSMALVVYRMLTGLLPFPVENTREMLIGRLTMTPRPLAHSLPGGSFPEAVQQVFDWGLQREQANRAPTIMAFAEALARAAAGAAPARAFAPAATAAVPSRPPIEVPATQITDAVHGRNPVGPQPVKKAALSNHKVLIGGAAVVVALVIGVGAWAMRDRDTESQVPPLASGDSVSPDSSPVSLYSGSDSTNSNPTPFQTRPTTTAEIPDPGNEGRDTRSGGGNPDPATTPATTPGIRIADAPVVLENQWDRWWKANAGRGLDPSVLRAMRDTARAVWDQADVDAQKTDAAFLLGSVLLQLEDFEEGQMWAQRALDRCTRTEGPAAAPTKCRRFEALVQSYRQR